MPERPLDHRLTDPPSLPAVIVVADDDRVSRDALATTLKNAGFKVVIAGDGQEAVELVGRGGVDLVMLDILMPRLGGIESCRIIKGMTNESFVPVMLVTVKTDTASRVEGLKIGADDYITKPFEEREMIARVEAMLRIKRLNDHLVSVRKKLERLSVYDELTGLYNYRHLHTRLQEEFKRAERYHGPLACVVVDVDNLRGHNERGGQALGDAILRGVADSLRRCVREVDVVARYGGEEFLVILPSTPIAGAMAVAERIFREIRGRVFGDTSANASTRATVSLGVATYPSQDINTKEALLRAADTAITNAKREGGNRIGVFQQRNTMYTPDTEPSSRYTDATARTSSDRPPASLRSKS